MNTTNYFKVFIRSFFKYFGFNILNFFCLVIGIISFFMTLSYINNEYSYDKHHNNYSKIYRIGQIRKTLDNEEKSVKVPFPLSDALLSDYSNKITDVVRIFPGNKSRHRIQRDEDVFFAKNFYFVDSAFFKLFNYNHIYSQQTPILDRPNTAVISEKAAKLLFKDENPIGKSFNWKYGTVEVIGVFKLPENKSHMNVDYAVSLQTMQDLYGGTLPQGWVWTSCWTYFKVNNEKDINVLEGGLSNLVKKNYGEIASEMELFIQPLTDIHLNSHYLYEMNVNGSKVIVIILFIVLGFIILACITSLLNFLFIFYSQRSKEIGLKRVFGESKFKFSISIFLISFLYVFATSIVIFILLVIFKDYSVFGLEFSKILSPRILLFFITLCISFGITSSLIVGHHFFSRSLSGLLINKVNYLSRKFSLQEIFAISILLSCAVILTSTFFINKQIQFIKQFDYGFDKDNIIIVRSSDANIRHKYQAFADELSSYNEIENVSGMQYLIGEESEFFPYHPQELAPRNKGYLYKTNWVRHGFFETFNIKILAGRSFSKEFRNDEINSIIINKTLVEQLGWRTNEAIGKKFKYHGTDHFSSVIGVIDNIKFSSLHNLNEPLIFDMADKERRLNLKVNYIAIKYNSKRNDQTINLINEVWNKYTKEPMEYFFFNEELDNIYRNEQRLGRIVLTLTFIILFVSLLSLYSIFGILVKRKEKSVSIRRILGNTSIGTAKYLTIYLSKLFAVAYILGTIISMFVINKWLNNYAEHIQIKATHYIPIFSTMILAFFATIFVHIIHSIRSDYVTILKNNE